VKLKNPPTIASQWGATTSPHQHKTFKFNKLA
jgi:hypothetical protein